MKTFIIDSHVLFCQGVVRILADYPDFEIVDETDTISEGIKKVCDLNPDSILNSKRAQEQLWETGGFTLPARR